MRTKIIATALATMLLAPAAFAAPAPTEFVNNGDFTQGSDGMDWWSTTSDTYYTDKMWGLTGTGYKEGSLGPLAPNNPQAEAVLSQFIYGFKGEGKLQFDLSLLEAGYVGYERVLWNGTEISSSLRDSSLAGVRATIGVAHLSFDVVGKKDGQNLLQFVGANYQSYNVIDNVSVTAVPEPETYAMMMAGLGLIGFAARTKKKTLS